MSEKEPTLAELSAENYTLPELAERTGRSMHAIREELAHDRAPDLGQFMKFRRWWFPQERVEAFMRSGEYTRWRGITGPELAAEFRHAERMMGTLWAREHLMKVYGVDEGALGRALKRNPSSRVSYAEAVSA